jgi:hypothetical protein
MPENGAPAGADGRNGAVGLTDSSSVYISIQVFLCLPDGAL